METTIKEPVSQCLSDHPTSTQPTEADLARFRAWRRQEWHRLAVSAADYIANRQLRYFPEPQDETARAEEAAANEIEHHKFYKQWRYATNEDVTAIAQMAIVDATKMIMERSEEAFKRYQEELPPRFQTVRLADYSASLPEQKHFASLVKDFGMNVIQRIDENTSLILFGPVGTGKSHMAACLGRQAAQLGFRVKWQNAKVLTREISRHH